MWTLFSIAKFFGECVQFFCDVYYGIRVFLMTMSVVLDNTYSFKMLLRACHHPEYMIQSFLPLAIQRLLKQLHAQNGEMQMVMDSANGCDTRISSVKNAVADYTIEVGTGTIEVFPSKMNRTHAFLLDALALRCCPHLYSQTFHPSSSSYISKYQLTIVFVISTFAFSS